MSPPTNQSDNRTDINAGKRSEKPITEDPTSSNAQQAEMMLVALRNLIVPLVQTVLPNKKDLQDVKFGREAEDLLTALQKYIASIIRDRSESDNEAGVKGAVIPEESSSIVSKAQEKEKSSENDKIDDKSSSSSGKGVTRTVYVGNKTAVLFPRVFLDHHYRFFDITSDWGTLDTILGALREKVFNELPIRLLCFKRDGPNLNITLLDRNEIYRDVISKAKDKFNSSSTFRRTLIHSSWADTVTEYAILSHTWLGSTPGEITFSDWGHNDFDQAHPGYQKLVNFCKVAADEHNVTFGWMDTVCINKESSTELDESIRSMYKWYKNAKNCIIYLAKTNTLSDMAKDPWFTRGWTLQELLAPKYITFYGAEWTTLGNDSFNHSNDNEIQSKIQLATTITPTELNSPLSKTPISRRMRWAARRRVTRGEDAAYSLMGIFNVSISIAYGEGADRAFMRLVKEILTTAKSDVLDLFNYADLGSNSTDISALIPSSPAAYLRRCEFDFGRATLIEPLTFTHLGLRIPIVLMPAVPCPRGKSAPYTPLGDYSARVEFPCEFYLIKLGKTFHILSTSSFASRSFSHEGAPLGFGFAVLNCGGFDESSIRLYKHCFAIPILYSHNNGIASPLGYKRRVETEEPIVFDLINSRYASAADWEYDVVRKIDLPSHGMQFLNMYL